MSTKSHLVIPPTAVKTDYPWNERIPGTEDYLTKIVAPGTK